jgi:enamine deaminase RidA (YjgF/YER057c/UK114 family)
MAFNLGRHRAFCTWLGSEQAFPKCMATASGIGCHGQALVIHALASDRAGVAIENPRQVPAYRYSTRYGPRPPCFARATAWVDDCARPLLLLGGTASVRGEASVHVGDLPAQIGETCGNLQALLANATTVAGHAWTASSVRSLRAYLPDVQIADQVERGFRKVFPAVDQIEMVHAQLCRRELLVEVEGVAVADQPRSERCE